MNKIAEQLALDFANGDYNEVYSTLAQYSGLQSALLAVLVYKELQAMSEHVGVHPENFIEWLQQTV